MVDLISTDKTQIALYTIDENQRRAGAQTLQTTNIERGILFEIRTRSLQRYKTVALSENRVTDILGRTLVHIPAGNHRDSSRRLGTGKVLIGTHLDDLIHETDGCAILLCCCRQVQACKQ